MTYLFPQTPIARIPVGKALDITIEVADIPVQTLSQYQCKFNEYPTQLQISI